MLPCRNAILIVISGLVVSEGDQAAADNVRKNFAYLLDSGRLYLSDARWSDFFRKGAFSNCLVNSLTTVCRPPDGWSIRRNNCGPSVLHTANRTTAST